ncbi:MAG: glycosyltransferase [Patescibacteria group bacterium]
MAELIISVVTFNKLEYTKSFLKSLYKNTHCDFKLHIVDNASDDGTPEYLTWFAQNTPNVELTLNSTNLGFGGAHNQVYSKVDSGYLLVINYDIILTDGVIDRVLDFAQKNNNYTQIGITNTYRNRSHICTPKAVIDLLTSHSISTEDINSTLELMSGSSQQFYKDFVVLDDSFSWISGWFFLLNIDHIKPPLPLMFDPIYKYGYQEDLDLSLTLREMGKVIGYLPEEFVVHFRSKSFNAAQSRFSHLNKVNLYRSNLKRLLIKWEHLYREGFKKAFLTSPPNFTNILIGADAVFDCRFVTPSNTALFLNLLEKYSHGEFSNLVELIDIVDPTFFPQME